MQGVDESSCKCCKTCENLTQPSEIEEASFRHGEELAHEDQEGHRGEGYRQHHQDLDRLEPLSLLG